MFTEINEWALEGVVRFQLFLKIDYTYIAIFFKMDLLKNITECFYELLAFKKLYEIVNVKEIIWLLYNLVVKSSSFLVLRNKKIYLS